MIAELLIGRSTRSNAYQAFKTLSSNRYPVEYRRIGQVPVR